MSARETDTVVLSPLVAACVAHERRGGYALDAAVVVRVRAAVRDALRGVEGEGDAVRAEAAENAARSATCGLPPEPHRVYANGGRV